MWRDSNGRIRSLSKFETEVGGKGLVRIEVTPEAAPYTWDDFKRLSGGSEKVLRALVRAARKDGANPKEWRVSFEPVKVQDWLSIEIWDGKRWEGKWKNPLHV